MTTDNRNRSTEPEEDLEQKVESLEREKASLERRLDRALAEIERLRRDLEEALRSLKRQAAPFSKGSSKPNPKSPGRKPGSAYGKRAFRLFPKRVDQQIAVPLPSNSPCCAAPIVYEDTKTQFQEDIVRLTIVRKFDIQVGRCACCGRHVQGCARRSKSETRGG